MTTKPATIVYTLTDEAPFLATASLLPIVQTFTQAAGIDIEVSDISLAARMIAAFPDRLNEAQKKPDTLAKLGALTLQPEANIIKLPNISASIPQLKAAIAELQAQGYALPNYPDEISNTEQQAIKDRYAKVLGSAVNPVLREGNSDRRAPQAVKQFARNHPHSMGKWQQTSQSHVDTMREGDFYATEQSVTMREGGQVRIEFIAANGVVEIKKNLTIQPGEIIDSMCMRVQALRTFFEKTLTDCQDSGILWSLHLKATMMKVSHPIMFGHAVSVFFSAVFDKHAETFKQLGVNPNNGLAAMLAQIDTLPAAQKNQILADIDAVYAQRPDMAMVDSDKGITNLHVPSNVIVDASMPAMIRSSGKMWNKHGKLQDVKAVIPDSTYARIYQEMINFCKTNGAFNPATMGSVSNVGLMAQQAEEYGSHDKTFEIKEPGTMRVVDDAGKVLMQHEVEAGDIWVACQTKDTAIRDWVKLAVHRARNSATPAVFWLEEERAHDQQLRLKVEAYLQEHDLAGLTIRILNYNEAIRWSMERIIRGQDTISVTGNVLRDYLTDLFPIMELGTSAKMLSIVPMLNGGCMYETGAGGSAPKHVQQLLAENYLRWDSLGEFLALAVSLEDVGQKNDNPKAQVLSATLDAATGKLLETGKSPSRKVGGLDNRGSHFYLALYWAQALAAQNEDGELAAKFAPLAHTLARQEAQIVAELNGVQGQAVDIGGYYHADRAKVDAVMRPSTTLNAALASV